MSVHKRRWKTAKGEMKEAWVIDYWHGGKRHHGGTFELRKDADAALAQIKVDKGSGKHVAPSRSITVEKAAQLWLEEAHDLERSTVKVYADVVAYHIVPMIGQAKLANITTAKVKEFQNSLREGGRSQYTIKRATQFLGSIIDEAVERGLHSHNVVRSISRKRKSGNPRQKAKLEVGKDIPLPQDIKEIIAGATEPRWRALLILLSFTGIRISEVRGLRWKNVDLGKAELHVRERADRFCEIGPPKTANSRRTVPLLPFVLNTLKEWRLQCPKFESDLVFPSPSGKPYHLQSCVRQGLIAAQGSSVKYTGIHCLRHFYASFCINREEDGGLGLPPKTVQDRLGHSTLAMTMDRYGHLFPQAVDTKKENDAILKVISG